MEMAEATPHNDLDVPVQKLLNHINTIKQKSQKQGEEILKLKGELTKAKTTNSRVRRIPKKTPADDVPEAQPAGS